MQPDTAPTLTWRPIESAPKDGTELLGYRPDQGSFVFRHADMLEVVSKDRSNDPNEDYDEGFSGWFHDVWGWLEGDEAPSHWMPLPPAPSEAPAQPTPCTECERLAEALQVITDGVERRLPCGKTVVDDHPDASELARSALASHAARLIDGGKG